MENFHCKPDSEKGIESIWDEEWFKRKALQEGDLEIGAGVPPSSIIKNLREDASTIHFAGGLPAIYENLLRAADRIEELEAKINEAENCLVCASISDASQVCEDTLRILSENNE